VTGDVLLGKKKIIRSSFLQDDAQVFYENKVYTSVPFQDLLHSDAEAKRYDASKNYSAFVCKS
jgi:hypothetical protein